MPPSLEKGRIDQVSISYLECLRNQNRVAAACLSFSRGNHCPLLSPLSSCPSVSVSLAKPDSLHTLSSRNPHLGVHRPAWQSHELCAYLQDSVLSSVSSKLLCSLPCERLVIWILASRVAEALIIPWELHFFVFWVIAFRCLALRLGISEC